MQKIKHYKVHYKNGSIKSEHFLLGDSYHRTDGPAYISYYENGNIKAKIYYLNGKLHRADGSAENYYDKNGNIITIYYYLNGNYANVINDKEFLIWQKTQILK